MFSLYPLTQNAVPIFKLGQKEYFAIGGGGMVGRGHVCVLCLYAHMQRGLPR